MTAVTIPRRRNYTAGQGGWFNPPPQRIPRREAESEIREYAFLDVTVQKMTREETRCVRGAGIEIGALGESWGDDRCSGLGISYISRRREASSSMLASFFLPLAPLLIGLLLFAFSGSVCCAHRRGRMKRWNVHVLEKSMYSQSRSSNPWAERKELWLGIVLLRLAGGETVRLLLLTDRSA